MIILETSVDVGLLNLPLFSKKSMVIITFKTDSAQIKYIQNWSIKNDENTI